MSFCFFFMWLIRHMIYASLALMIERKSSHNRSDCTVLHYFTWEKGCHDCLSAHSQEKDYYDSLKFINTVDLQGFTICFKSKSFLCIIANHHCTYGNRLMIRRKWLLIWKHINWWKKGKPYSQNSLSYSVLKLIYFVYSFPKPVPI